MQSIRETILKNRSINVINDNKNDNANDSNVVKSKYALDRKKFIPNTEESQLAEKIATKLDDLNNFAFYFKVVKKLGVSIAMQFEKSFWEEVEEKMGTKYEIRSPKKYFTWKYRKGLY